MIVDLVSKFIEDTRGHPLNVTVSEAQLLHDFATWADGQAAQHGVQADGATWDCQNCKCVNSVHSPACVFCLMPRR